MKRAKSIFLWCGDPPAGGEQWRGCLPAKALASEGLPYWGFSSKNVRTSIKKHRIQIISLFIIEFSMPEPTEPRELTPSEDISFRLQQKGDEYNQAIKKGFGLSNQGEKQQLEQEKEKLMDEIMSMAADALATIDDSDEVMNVVDKQLCRIGTYGHGDIRIDLVKRIAVRAIEKLRSQS